jgi:hypothetical protein
MQHAHPNQTVTTLQDVLAQIDPRDSDAALALFSFLEQSGRIHKVGMLDSVGFLLVYREPEGSTKAGYTAGGTLGDRIVESALANAKASGAKVERGLCPRCMSAVIRQDGEAPRLDNPDVTDPFACKDGDPHDFA